MIKSDLNNGVEREATNQRLPTIKYSILKKNFEKLQQNYFLRIFLYNR